MAYKSKSFWIAVFYKYSFLNATSFFFLNLTEFFLKMEMPEKLFLNCITFAHLINTIFDFFVAFQWFILGFTYSFFFPQHIISVLIEI